MGRIDEALRRSNVDAVRGTGAPASAPEPSPWGFEPRDGSGAEAPPAPKAAEPATTPAAAVAAPPEDDRPVLWDGLDAGEGERFVVSKPERPLLIEQFRSLAATLHGAQDEQRIKSIIVTSPSPGDGKSYVAVNLALTLSASYRRRVLLIDADLRRPSLHNLFRIAASPGLSEALGAGSDNRAQATQVSRTLAVLPAGRPQSDPLSGLSSERMKRLIADAADRFDWVIVDSPPVGVLADARLVSETVDGALLVVRAGMTRYPDLEAAADAVGHERILGLVLNAVEPAEIRGEGYYSQYYGHDPSSPGK